MQLSNSLSDIIAKSVVRDRTKPVEKFVPRNGIPCGSDANDCTLTPDLPDLPTDEIPEEESQHHDSSPLPPWAAAFASISAARGSTSKSGPSSTRVTTQKGRSVARKGFGERFGLYQQPDSFLPN